MNAQAQNTSIETLEPHAVWQIFSGIAAVPRASKKEEQIRRHVRDWAKEHNLVVREEAVGNLIIDVPATPGHENAPITVLQGHLDMVCEKNRGTEHDFDRDPIKLIIDNDVNGECLVHAAGTTLGADNGMGVALALAAAINPQVVHGPLELLLTIDEEAGMTGAKALTPESFKGRRLLNLDSEEDDCLYIGCAGGCDTNLSWSFSTDALEKGSELIRIAVEGLRGGHSGCDIQENRGNAIKLLTRTLLRVPQGSLRLCEIAGGSKRNAIPRESHAILSAPAGSAAALQKAAAAVRQEGMTESDESGLTIAVETLSADEAQTAISTEDTARLLAALAALPSSVLGMNPKVPGLVQISNNLSTVTSKRESDRLVVVAGTLTRSSSDSFLKSVTDQIASIGQLAGAKVAFGNSYPGWEPDVDSPLLATCRKLYENVFGQAPNVAAIHAGLECGIIGQRVGTMDMISFGPRIEGAHSPDERVYVESVAKIWNYLIAVLGELAKG